MSGKYINIKKLGEYIKKETKVQLGVDLDQHPNLMCGTTILNMTWNHGGLFSELPIFVLLCVERDRSLKSMIRVLMSGRQIYHSEASYLLERIKLYSEIYNKDFDKLERKDRIWVNNKSEFASEFET